MITLRLREKGWRVKWHIVKNSESNEELSDRVKSKK